MSRVTRLATLNRFLHFPYVVQGYEQFSGERISVGYRQYSLYQMRDSNTLELVPLPIQFIEETESLTGFQSARLIYQQCILSGDWISPFTRGCVKLTRELIPALTELGVLKEQYFEAFKDSQNVNLVNRTLLRSLGDCAYDMLSSNYIIKRGNSVMTKNGTAVLEQETEPKAKTRGSNSKMFALYNLIRQDEATPESLNAFEWYLSKQFGSIDVACKVLQEFNAHLNAKTFVIAGIDKNLSADDKVQVMRALGVSSSRIEETLMGDREESAQTFDLEKAIAKAKASTEKPGKNSELLK